MKRYSLQTPLKRRSGPLGLGLVILFLLVPYLVDVAYFGDYTPTHYAQANFSDGEEASFFDGKPALALTLDQVHSAEASLHLAMYFPCVSTAFPSLEVFYPRYWSFSTHLSRPPPAI